MTYRVALVQNQSEMASYSYADVRLLLRGSFGYDTRLYTAQNIQDLRLDLAADKVDALMLASNALNDKAIRAAMYSEGMKDELRRLLERGGGCLVLHQLRLGEQARDGEGDNDEGTLDFLPANLGKVRAMARSTDEPMVDGQLQVSKVGLSHPVMVYPNEVGIEEIQQQCLGFEGLKGLYWHSWDRVDASDWDTLVFDETRPERVLALVTKEATGPRVVLSSLTLDWQGQTSLLNNFLVYIVEGRHHTAVLADRQKNSVAFDYFLERMRAEKFPFQLYRSSAGAGPLLKSVEKGIHSIVVLGPSLRLSEEHPRHYRELCTLAKRGQVKLLELGLTDDNSAMFQVQGRERYVLHLLHQTELRVQGELRAGYIDGSFLSTVQTLQALREMSDVKGVYELEEADKALEQADTHDRLGAYDGVFGASCGLLWMRATFRGLNADDTQRTCKWVRQQMGSFREREQALAYMTMIETGASGSALDQDLSELNRILGSLDYSKLSEIDGMFFLRAALLVSHNDAAYRLTVFLVGKQEDGAWIDLATTASITSSLLKARSLLLDLNRLKPGQLDELDNALFKSIIFIQNARTNTKAGVSYPWDGKASTSVKCMKAWLEFEELIDLPVVEMMQSLSSYAAATDEIQAGETSLVVLEELKQEARGFQEQSEQLGTRLTNVEARSATQERVAKALVPLTTFVTVAAYMGISVLFYIGAQDKWTTAGGVVKSVFVDAWAFHLTTLGVVFAAVAAWAGVRALRKTSE